MHPIIWQAGGFSLHAYGLLVATGLVVGVAVIAWFAWRYEKIAPDITVDLALWSILASIVGARLLYVVGQWDYYREHPLEIVMLQNGGLVFLGGFLLGWAVLYWLTKRRHLPLLKLMDATAPGISIGYAIGRLGCFLNGCCFGLPTNLPWGVTFPAGSLASQYCPGGAVQPTQLYSALAMTAAALFCAFLYRRKKFDGQIAAWWFILYPVYRFTVEFFRFSPLHWLGLTPVQWLVLPLLIAGIGGLYYLGRQHA
ncbi:MAG: prolipoprotein diacylglyceryl transferase [Candidatus Margulisbacteria bacterium]|jgi:phosphatidylglycerol:prolipoprotein diacylglycerol transferase|nr:prolipoprotein diacylglyceryl transferase [Candidatus Margulisiibacteriota bacterium]